MDTPTKRHWRQVPRLRTAADDDLDIPVAEGGAGFYNSREAIPNIATCAVGPGRRKRMKLSKAGQIILTTAVSIGIGFGVISCGESNTIDYVYVTANKQNPGQISVYQVDELSGALTQIPDSPYPSGGRDPVAEALSPNGANLYVANHDDNAIVEFDIGTDAKLYPQHTYQTPGSEPQAIAINQAGTYLYVVDTCSPGETTCPISSSTGTTPQLPGALIVYPVNKDGSLGTPVANGTLPYWPVQYEPATINVTANSKFVYVGNDNNNTPPSFTGAGRGTVSAFAVGSNGALTPVYGPGSANPSAPLPYAGVQPSASVSDPTSRFLYVTDAVSNELYAYTIGSDGTLTPLTDGPFATGTFPDSITIDPSGQYIYVANFTSNSISAYQITPSTGAPSALAGATSYITGTGPTCVMIEPAFGRYLFTTNFLNDTLSGFKLNPNSGALTGTENSPYPSAGQPTCAVAVSHGNHPGEHVQAISGNGQQ